MKAPDELRLAVAQANPAAGDVAGNLALARRLRREAAAAGAQLVLLPELFLSGCPLRDLAPAPDFADACRAAVEDLARDTADGGPGIVAGCPLRTPEGLFDAVALLDGGAIAAWRSKVDLPDVGGADASRIFRAGPMPGPVNFRGIRIGLAVGDDIHGDGGVCETLAESGAEILLVSGASPFGPDALDRRHQLVLRQVITTDLPIVFANLVGGQDDLVFDGASFAFGTDRRLAFQMPAFETALAMTIWRRGADGVVACADGVFSEIADGEEAVWRASVLALRDHAGKNGFAQILFECSDDIATAVAGMLAVDALGPERVSSLDFSADPPERLATPAGIRRVAISLAGVADAHLAALRTVVAGPLSAQTSAVVDAGQRRTFLAALAVPSRAMAMGTADRTALSMGADAPADVGADFLPLRHLLRTDLHRLARWRNANRPAALLGSGGPVIPEDLVAGRSMIELGDAEGGLRRVGAEAVDAVLRGVRAANGGSGGTTSSGIEPWLATQVERRLVRTELARRRSAPGPMMGAAPNVERPGPFTHRFGEKASRP